ncbi:hypothetical protein [Nocardia colli]|uniref:hypothetical protein n=1 Tax=Nocardia colli TaxID=2545717 RepID=UPI0035DC15CA
MDTAPDPAAAEHLLDSRTYARSHRNVLPELKFSKRSPVPFYRINPEAPADFGAVELDESFDPPRVVAANFEFAAPIRESSEMIKSYGGAYAVTDSLAEALQSTDLTGYRFGPITTSVSATPYVEDTTTIRIPPLRGFVVTGEAFVDDFGIASKGGLIGSEKAARFLFARDPELEKVSFELDERGKVIFRLP